MIRKLLTILCCLSLVLALVSCTAAPDPSPSAAVPTASQSQAPAPTPSESEPPAPAGTSAPTETPAPSETPEVSPTPTPDPTESPEPSVDPEPTPAIDPAHPQAGYEWGTPLVQTEVVEDTFFDTVVFLGDSRTEGLQIFGGLRRGTYLWARGMTVFRVDDPKYAIFDVDGESLTMIGALGKKEYTAVYIMVGVNELGYMASSYETNLAIFIDKVLEAQPNAVVYLQTLPPVNESVAAANGLASYINNTNIGKFNAAIVRVATEKKVILLDTAEVYRDENGSLPANMASDGCHFVFSGYAPWVDYLRCHVMDPEVYFALRAAEDTPEPEPSEEPTPEPSAEPSAEPTYEVSEV